ncbi:unnamed protein product [Ostreobium quekettii]|uniref:Beta-lactamase/transpeptidase-like protein n=1 Tax=Ostreobium quekettii TaxID=121088 RepID=A0A8S1J6Z1_9CHLO|nr:unnamed protein product [Ostreobium quekettii]
MNWQRNDRPRRVRQQPLLEAQQVHADATNADQHLQQQETVDQLYVAIRRLPKADAALVLLYLDELSYREIADVLGISESNVGVKLNRAKKALAGLMNGLQGDSPTTEAQTLMESGTTVNLQVNAFSWPAWAENWNRIIPSWSVAACILLPTIAGAYAGKQFPLPDMGPVLFQSIVAAVICFEAALLAVWLQSKKRRLRTPAVTDGPKLPKGPAIATIVLTLLMGVLAIVALYSFAAELEPWDSSWQQSSLPDISAFDKRATERIDRWLQSLCEDRYPSLSAVVIRDGKVVYKGAFGFEDLRAARPATPQTQYHVASVTKVFTASLAVILHERGVIDLDRPVVEYLPDGVNISTTPEVGDTITLRQLASHTSGLPRRVPGPVQSAEGHYQLEPQKLYRLLAELRLESKPGTAQIYSNLGYGVLGHVLELAADRPFHELMDELICEPLKLQQTAIQADDSLRPATGYDRQDWQVEQTHSYRERLAGSGGLITSIDDLASFLAAQLQPNVLTRAMLDQLHTEAKLSTGLPAGTALGWTIAAPIQDAPVMREAVDHVLEKNGGRSNCSAWIGFAPDHKVAVAVVTNCGGPYVDPIGRRLLEQAVPSSQKRLREPRYARVSPYSGIRWENDRPLVRIDDQWYDLLAVDGISVDRIVGFAKKQYGRRARKRVAEDLIQILAELGHDPDWEVTLDLRTQDGTTVQQDVLMTKRNRNQVRS